MYSQLSIIRYLINPGKVLRNNRYVDNIDMADVSSTLVLFYAITAMMAVGVFYAIVAMVAVG